VIIINSFKKKRRTYSKDAPQINLVGYSRWVFKTTWKNNWMVNR